MEPSFSIDFTAKMLASEACNVGNVLVYDSAAGVWKVSTTANRTAANAKSQAIALSSYGGSVVGKVSYQATGTLAAEVSGLGVGVASWVRCSSTGLLERVSPSPGDDICGFAEADGRVHLCFGTITAQMINGSGSAITLTAGDGIRVTGSPFYTVHGVRGTCSLEQFGAVGNDATLDGAAMVLAMAALTAGTYGTLVLGAKTYDITNAVPITPPASTTIMGQGNGPSILKTTANNTTILISNEDCTLSKFQILGNSTGANQVGVRSGTIATPGSGVSRLMLSDVTFKNLGADGFQYNQNPLNGGASTYMGPALSNVIADGCATGFRLGERGEYCNFSNCHAQRSTGFGGVFGAGNYTLSGCTFTFNHDGADFTLSTNGVHGGVAGCKFNHNTNHQVRYGGGYGQQLVGCQIYGTQITVTGATAGFELIGCEIDVGAWVVGAGATLRLADCLEDNIYGNDVSGVDTGATVIIENCHRLDGTTPAWWLPWLQQNFTFSSDANKTLTYQQSYCETLVIQSGTISTLRKITSLRSPQAGGKPQRIINNNAQGVQLAWSSGSAYTIPAGQWALVGSDGTGAIGLEWGDASGGGGGISVSGTGLVHVTSGSVDAAAHLVVNADVDAAAAIDVSKLSHGLNGTYLATTGGVPTWQSIVASDINSIPGSSGNPLYNNGGAIGAAGNWSIGTGLTGSTSSFVSVNTYLESPRLRYSSSKILVDSDGTSAFIGTDQSYANQHTNLRAYVSGTGYLGIGSSNNVVWTSTTTYVQSPAAGKGTTWNNTTIQSSLPHVGDTSAGSPYAAYGMHGDSDITLASADYNLASNLGVLQCNLLRIGGTMGGANRTINFPSPPDNNMAYFKCVQMTITGEAFTATLSMSGGTDKVLLKGNGSGSDLARALVGVVRGVGVVLIAGITYTQLSTGT